jgi:hypothetical protein
MVKKENFSDKNLKPCAHIVDLVDRRGEEVNLCCLVVKVVYGFSQRQSTIDRRTVGRRGVGVGTKIRHHAIMDFSQSCRNHGLLQSYRVYLQRVDETAATSRLQKYDQYSITHPHEKNHFNRH